MAMDMNAAVKITASVNGGQAIDQLKSSIDRLDSSATKMGQAFGAAKIAVGAFLAVQATKLVFASEVVNMADELGKMSQKTGIAVETLNELKYAGDLAGVSIEQIQGGLTKLSVKAMEAAKGSATAKTAFDALGISVVDGNGKIKSQIQLFEEAAAALRDIESPTARAAMGVQLFGKSFVELIPLINTMEESREEARQMGIVFGDDFAQASEQFNDNITRMQSLLKGISIQIMNETLPSINRLMDAMIEASKQGEGFFGTIGAGIRQLAINAGTDFKDLDKSIASTETRLASLIEMRDALSKPTITNKLNDLIWGDVRDLNLQIGFATEELRQLKAARDKMNAEKPAGGGTDVLAELEKLEAAEEKAKASAKAAEEATKAAAAQEKQRASILRGLGDQITRLNKGEQELTIEKLRRLGANDREIAQARRLMAEQENLEEKTKSAKEATALQERQEKERISTLENLRGEIMRLAEGEDEYAVQKLRNLGATEEEIAQLRELQSQRSELKRINDENNESLSTQKALMSDLESQGKRLFEETRTPAEAFAAELERINMLWQNGAIDIETYQRAIAKAQDEFDNLANKGKSALDELKAAIDGWGKKSADALVDFAMKGKGSFKDFADSVIAEILRMVTYQMIMKPLFDTIGSTVGSFFSSPTPAAKGMAFNEGAQAFAKGGIVNTATPFKFAQSGTIRNGIMGEAGPEAIMPLKRGADGKLGIASAGGQTSVVVNNYSSAQAKTEEKMDSRGNRRIEVTIGEMVANEVRRPGSAAFSSVRETFGARPALVGR